MSETLPQWVLTATIFSIGYQIVIFLLFYCIYGSNVMGSITFRRTRDLIIFLIVGVGGIAAIFFLCWRFDLR